MFQRIIKKRGEGREGRRERRKREREKVVLVETKGEQMKTALIIREREGDRKKKEPHRPQRELEPEVG